jgi:hypothetical protein
MDMSPQPMTSTPEGATRLTLTRSDPCGYTGYADLNYFRAAAQSSIVGDPTIHPAKYGEIFLVNLGAAPQLRNLPPGQAIMYKAARLEFAAQDPNINQTPWQRAGGRSVNVTPDQIIFRGRPGQQLLA